jgi:GNAT superfamily N-acetyltransferase
MTAAEIEFMAKRLLPILDERQILLAEVRGEPVAFILGVPDFNEVLGRLRGRLLSPRLPLILPYLAGLKRSRTTRVIALGIRREYRQRGIDAALIASCLRAMLRAGYERCEMSWLLEDNVLIRSIGDMFGGTVYKRYALYDGPVDGP